VFLAQLPMNAGPFGRYLDLEGAGGDVEVKRVV
jgi:hypothetical protein